MHIDYEARERWIPASMGPRLVSRGNNWPWLEDFLRWYASMGPRLVSRGNPSGMNTRSITEPRFNGAAAREPRKSASGPLSKRTAARFNGAAAREPRKSDRGD